jgi:hypothetical protein
VLAKQEPMTMSLSLSEPFRGPDADYAVRLVHSACCMAGVPDFVDGYRRTGKNSLAAAIKARDTARLFNWLVEALSYQGISDQNAFDYMQAHGRPRWADIEGALDQHPPCPKLQSYWQFYDCRFQKGSASCAEPQHMADCPLPALPLRNGHLNQMAYSLFLFIRDMAAGDLVGWIDGRLAAAERPTAPDRLDRMRAALLDPLRCIYGVSDKVLSTSLSGLLLAAGKERPLWGEVGASLIAIDTLVHNFLHRTGLLARLQCQHAYGPACYRANGCAAIVAHIAAEIDAREFNRKFPKSFPRFVQHAIWRYCAGSGLDICNGNQIDDRNPCQNSYCRLFTACDRVTLRNLPQKMAVNA